MGRFRIGRHRLTFIERATSGPRRLVTDVLYPLAGSGRPARGPLPLIVFGPGFMQCGGPYSRLLRAWASAGYVVATVNFPYSDCVAAAPTESDMVNQPADMSQVITSMLALSARSHGLFAGLLSPRQVAVAGQSDGGDTVAAVAANTCCTDRRVTAVAVLSGAQWPAMPGTFFTRRPVPMLFTQGSADTVNLPGCSAAMYHADPARARYYLALFGADHTGPYWGTNRFERIVARVTLAFFDRYVLGQAAAGPAMRRHGDVPGTAALFSHGAGEVPPGPCVT
jgi:dienelactone hydrolase